jgi:metal-responsive CopG/Arc/MetJ family transcriptional regulator
MKTIQMIIDEPLLKTVDRLSRMRKINRSAFIRNALLAEVAKAERLEQERRHVAGYRKLPVATGEFDAWEAEQDWGSA